MKNYSKWAILFTVFSLMSSCAEQEVDIAIAEDSVEHKEVLSDQKMGISADCGDIDSDDACIVAAMFGNDQTQTRNQQKSVRNVVDIADDNGEIVMYAVNYNEGGYVLISKSKKSYPILAEVDKGEFSLDDYDETGECIVISDMISNINMLRIDSEKKKDIAWAQYERKQKKAEVRGNVNSFGSEYYDALNEIMTEYGFTGDDIRYLGSYYHADYEMSSDVYRQMVSAAESSDPWQDTEYSWDNTAIVITRYKEKRIQYGPFLQTTWNQDMVGVTSGYYPLGCVTIAVGQLMNYYRHPAYLEWDKISTYNTNQQKDFLITLRGKLKVDANGSSNINNAKDVMEDYGYSVSIEDHNISSVYSSLANSKPLYERGTESGKTEGHAWVCDGYKYMDTYMSNILFILDDSCYPDLKYMMVDEYIDYLDVGVVRMFHMNWGWGGTHDGWYFDNFHDSTNATPAPLYTTKRKNLIIKSFK